MDDLGLVTARARDPFEQSLRTGRLQKLARMGLATHLGGDSWRLEPGIADTLRRMGERGDIIRTMQRELTARRSEEHTSELQSLMRISYAVFCLKKKNKHPTQKSKKRRIT